MKGIVTASNGATLVLQVGRRPHRKITAVIDTGYSGCLMLPPYLIRALRLRAIGRRTCILADGTNAEMRVFQDEVFWNRRYVSVQVDEMDATPLIGMELLRACELYMQVIPDGTLIVERLLKRLRHQA